jgi:hypothetical protein
MGKALHNLNITSFRSHYKPERYSVPSPVDRRVE